MKLENPPPRPDPEKQKPMVISFKLENEMSDRDANHLLIELQEARSEIDRLRMLIQVNTLVRCQGKAYWPEWVVKELNPVDRE